MHTQDAGRRAAGRSFHIDSAKRTFVFVPTSSYPRQPFDSPTTAADPRFGGPPTWEAAHLRTSRRFDELRRAPPAPAPPDRFAPCKVWQEMDGLEHVERTSGDENQ